MIKLNLSGHQNPQLETNGYKFPGTIQIDPKKEYAENLKSVTQFLQNQGLNSNSIIDIALPGMSMLASMVIIAVHGMTGQFPFITTLVRNDDGSFGIGETVDAQMLRNTVARNARKTIEL